MNAMTHGEVDMRRLLFGSLTLAALFTVAPASAADIPGSMPVKAPPIVAYYDWAGFYFGAHIGFDRESYNLTVFHSVTGELRQSLSGRFPNTFAGFQAGYNFMVARSFLLGLEADVSRNNAGTWGFGVNEGSFGEGRLGWSGTLRGRIGYAFDRVLLYGTAGYAWSNVDLTRLQINPFNPTAPPATLEMASATRTGIAVGGGIEVGVLPDLTVRAEYRHIDYSAFEVVFPISQRRADIATHSETVLLGANYKLNWGNWPVIVKN
jgi:outer membrane immunogenic protein